MSQPPLSGPVRQPLQTYLGSAVRPAVTPAPVPVPAPVAVSAGPVQTPPTSTPTDPDDPFATPALFGGPSSLGSSAALSALLGPQASSGSVFDSPASGPTAPAATAPPLAPIASAAVASPTRSSGAVSVRLERTTGDHPLLGGGGLAASSPLGPSAAAAVVPSPLHSISHPLATPLTRPSSATVATASPTSLSGPPLPVRLSRASSTGGGVGVGSPSNLHAPTTAGSPAASPSSPQVSIGTANASSVDPLASPDEKLSTLLAQLFQGSPPPAKLATFDVSSQPRNEAGATKLAEHGCWREVVRVCEQALATGTTEGGSQSAASPQSSQPPAPHVVLRLVHLQASALVKLRKYDQAHVLLQQRLGNAFAADKLYASHPAFYGPGGSFTESGGGAAARVGNMVPFELHLLATEVPHHLRRTRQALDQQMKLMQFLRVQLQRKRAEEAATPATAAVAAAAVTPSTSPDVPSEKRPSLIIVDGVSTASTGAASGAIPQNPFSVHSPHTATSLTSSQLRAQLATLRMHIANLCLSLGASSAAAAAAPSVSVSGGAIGTDADYEQAAAWLRELAKESPEDATLPHALARLFLQTGDLRRATACIARAKGIYESQGDKDNVQIGLHHVLLCLARNDYSGAHATASSLFASHPYDARVVNNYAVCALYVNQIQAGVAALEALIRKDPIAHVCSSVLTNLRALYDLSSPNPSLKRRMLEGLVLMYGGDDLELAP